MKRPMLFVLIAVVTVSVVLLPGCSRKKERVKAYVEAINFEHQLVVNRLDALERSLESYIPEIMDKAYGDVLQQLDSSELVVRNLKPPRADANLRDEALLLFDTYRLLVENEYIEIIERQKKPAGRFTVADEFLVNNLGKFIHNNRNKAKIKYEQVAAGILEQYGIPFEPVNEEVPAVNPSKTPGSATQAR